jgi:type II secretory pathway pseudopilin PulG
MIVVAIIAILAGILIPNFVNARAQAQTSACESNLRSIATAMELYYADNQVYPNANSDVTTALNGGPNGVKYLPNTPRDPADQNPTNPGTYSTSFGSTGDAQSYAIKCPGVHVKTTLSKINTPAGALCGPQCATTTLYYGSGIGLYTQ